MPLLKTKKIGFVVPSYNRLVHLYRCIDAAFKYTKGLDFWIYVVEDHSPKREAALAMVDELKEIDKRKKLILIETEKNLGYAGATKAGQKYAVNDGCEFIIDGDDDCYIVNETTVKCLLYAMQQDKYQKIGIAAPFAGFLNRFISKHKDAAFLPVSSCGGGFGMIRSEALQKAGYFDENLRIAADVDLCIKLWLAGYLCVVQPLCRVKHLRHQQGGIEMSAEEVQQTNLPHQSYLEDKYMGLVSINKRGSLLWWRAFKKLTPDEFLFLREDILGLNDWNLTDAELWINEINNLNMRY